MQIDTGRFTLRLLEAQDAPWIAREISNPRVQVWLTSPPHPYTLADAEAFIAKFGADDRYRVITDGSDPLGVVSLSVTSDGGYDLGYWLREAAWGRGAMTECARALLAWHFTRSDVPVTSGWITGNAASQNVLTKLGFAAHGTKQAQCHFRNADVTVEKVRLTATQWHNAQRLSVPQ